jgi:ribonucleoside-diphosphate reductase alpha chain
MQRVMEVHEHAGQALSGKVSKSKFKQLSNLAEITQKQAELFKENISLGVIFGYRNSQVSVLAPTGTISFFMDSTTTGVEPEFSLVKTKKVADGTSIKIANKEVSAALVNLGYNTEEIDKIEATLTTTGNIYEAKELREEDYAVFSCAIGENAIKPMGHVKMMAAIQPFISGAISKTVNLPESATVADVKEIYIEGWKLGLKDIAIYRDNCKVGQPLSSTAKPSITGQEVKATIGNLQEKDSIGKPHPSRVRLPQQRKALTTSFNVGGAEGYLTAGSFADGQLGEVFLKMSKQGSTLAGVMDAFAISVSIGLQYGVPLETFIEKFTNSRFEPSGLTNDKEIRMASSVMDYVFRRLALDFLSEEERATLGILTNEERINYLNQEVVLPVKDLLQQKSATKEPEVLKSIKNDAPLCFSCGVQMQRSGSCHVCPNCGGTSGCS